ncbi:MAG: hypothetical protein M3Z54_07565 [Gemmatimonadota bacterium]|nr:hypothetical protein [Gemmatimonadota bacterium]
MLSPGKVLFHQSNSVDTTGRNQTNNVGERLLAVAGAFVTNSINFS